MSKVIIITRDGEYNSEQNFFNAIENMEKCSYCQNAKIKDRCLDSWTLLKWNDANKKYTKDGEVDTDKVLEVFNLDKKEYYDQFAKGDDEPKNWAIEKLKNNMSADMSNPYASFPIPEKYEVILLLPEKLQIGKNEAIPDFVEFMNWVKEDCSIDGNDNILYIHDTQLYGTEIKDTTIHDKDNGVDLTDEDKSLFKKLELSKLKDTYKFIAVFRHIPDKTSYFQSQILSLEFGQPNLIDELEKIDSSLDWEERIRKTNEAVKKHKEK